jgi:poly(3-hydroxybutyrate) depolymerase
MTLVQFGCVNLLVMQPPGKGVTKYERLKATKAKYWLYYPKDFEASRVYPVVFTLHGMKPFDNAKSQSKEWQDLADRHGLVVCAPELYSSDLLSIIPLDRMTPSLEKDVNNLLHIIAHISRHPWYDKNNVLVTSWSYGGYIAHYMFNHYPAHFTHLVARQSNFSSKTLNAQKAQSHAGRPIAITYGQGDFPICVKESEEAVDWYRRMGYNVVVNEQKGKIHQRTPEVAAEFFMNRRNGNVGAE